MGYKCGEYGQKGVVSSQRAAHLITSGEFRYTKVSRALRERDHLIT